MSCGLPVIAPKVGGLKEIIDDGIDGYLIENRKPSAFVDKILLLQNNQEIYIKMSLAAKAKIRAKFSAEHMALQYHRLYLQTTNTLLSKIRS